MTAPNIEMIKAQYNTWLFDPEYWEFDEIPIEIDVRPEQQILVPSKSWLGSLLGRKEKRTLIHHEYPNPDDLRELVGARRDETLIEKDLLVLDISESERGTTLVVRAAFVKERTPECRVTLGKPVLFGGRAVIYNLNFMNLGGGRTCLMSNVGFAQEILGKAFNPAR